MATNDDGKGAHGRDDDDQQRGLEPTQASKPPADTDDDDDGDHRSCTCDDDDDHAGMHFEFLRHPIPDARSAITQSASLCLLHHRASASLTPSRTPLRIAS